MIFSYLWKGFYFLEELEAYAYSKFFDCIQFYTMVGERYQNCERGKELFLIILFK